MVIDFKNVSFKYSDKPLLDSINFSVTDSDKVGLIGINGCGKSTILKLIVGLEKPQKGEIIKSGNMIINYLEQDSNIEKDITCFSYVMKLSTKEHPINDYEVNSVLTKLKLNPNTLTNHLSGGEMKRLSLARVLVSYCDFLILDEPTNHLDNDMISFLEKYLMKFNHALFMVTHDRYFLEKCVNTMIELDNSKTYLYKANYSKFLIYKEERMNSEAKEAQKLKSILKTEREWMNRGVEARRTKSKSRIERFKKLEEIEFKENKDFMFESLSTRLGKKTIEIKNGSKAFSDKVLFKDFNFNLLKTDRIGIVGDNGAGKSTLFKIIMQEETLDSGELILGETLNIGYFKQHFDSIDPEITVLKYIEEDFKVVETLDGKISASELLERFLFSKELLYTKVKSLSGGQRRRLQLVKVLSKNPNILILDEPTNDLDIYTMEVLEDYLDNFKGPILVVSHDRYFLDKVVDKLLYFKDFKINEYNGSFSEFLDSDLSKKTEFKEEKKTYQNKHSSFSSKEKNELYELSLWIEDADKQINSYKEELKKPTSDYNHLVEVQVSLDKLEEEYGVKIERYFYLEEKREESK